MNVYFYRLDDGTEPTFVCERVCTSDRLMRRMGGLAKVRNVFVFANNGIGFKIAEIKETRTGFVGFQNSLCISRAISNWWLEHKGINYLGMLLFTLLLQNICRMQLLIHV